MPASVLDMSMSVDGYIAAPNDEPGNPGGDDFVRLHEWGLTPNGAVRRWPPAVDLLPSRIELEIVRVIDTPEATHIRYRVHR